MTNVLINNFTRMMPPVLMLLVMASCHTNNKPLLQNVEPVAWDTTKIKAAVNGYLTIHEKYYTLIDSIDYWIDTLSTRRVLLDQSNYYIAVGSSLPNQLIDTVEKVGQIITKLNPAVQRYYDTANDYLAKASQVKATDMQGFRVFVKYRLTDVMLTYSDFTPRIFYFDTAYQLLKKSNFLHYVQQRLNPNETGLYFDTTYPYTPSKN